MPRRGMHRRRTLVLATTLSLVAVMAAAPAYAVSSTPLDRIDDVTEVELTTSVQAGTLSTRVLSRPSLADWMLDGAPHVVVIGSGVDVTSLPDVFASQVTHVTPEPDIVGYGTWAAAGIFQVAPGAKVTSINVYPKGKLSGTLLPLALEWVVNNRATTQPPIDAVVLAFPQGDYVDPVTAAQNPQLPDAYKDLLDTMVDRPFETSNGTVYAGMPSSGTPATLAGTSKTEQAVVAAFQKLSSGWNRSRGAISTLAGSGIPVVAAAGDGGTKLQSVQGLANLRDVVTVGSSETQADGSRRVIPESGSGPSLEGAVKPDVLAPVLTAALVPPKSALTKVLPMLTDISGLWPEEIEAEWSSSGTVPRNWLGSTMSAATLVATHLAVLRANGVTDIGELRGALIAAAEPLLGVHVWRQGAGVAGPIDVAHAGRGSFVAGNLDLGLTPPSGDWGASVRVLGGTAGVSTTGLVDYSGFGPRGETVVKVVATADAPPVTGTGGTTVSLLATRDDSEPGLYCGYTSVPLGPDVEKVPTCLVRSMELYAESRYIHNEPAEDVTYELLPALPPTVDRLTDRPFMLLPMDATRLPMYVAKVQPGACAARYPDGYPKGLDPDTESTRPQTCAYFPAIAPGYYQTRLFSDYGAPTTWQGAGAAGRELGKKVAYQKLPMWLLPTPLSPERNPDGSGRDVVSGTVTYRWDRTTDTWVVGDLEDAGLRFAYGYLKRIVGTAVTSRVVDLVDYDSFGDEGFDALSLSDLTKLSQLGGLPVSDETSAWQWTRSATDPTGIDATFNPVYAPAGKVAIGVAKYPISLTTPNYLLHASVNLEYRVTDAVVLVFLEAGHDVAMATIQPKTETLVTPKELGEENRKQVPVVFGTVTGEANIEFNLKPKGAATGMLTIVTLPTAQPVNTSTVYSAGSVSLSGMSIQYDTWTTAKWPQMPFCANAPMQPAGTTACPDGTKPENLHVFSAVPNYDARQVPVDATGATKCRIVGTTEVCENWDLVVHAPKRDAYLKDVLDGGPDLHDPVRPSVRIDPAVLAEHDVLRYAPPARTTPFTLKPILDSAGKPTGSPAFALANPVNGATNNRFWDQVVLPLSLLRERPGQLSFRIVNNAGEPAPTDARAPLVGTGGAGPVPLSPYVCYVNASTRVDAPLPI